MAKKKAPEAPKGSPAWMATFSDLMNLLLCFFVLLFSMSSVDAKKFEMVVQSLQQSFSILPAGGTTVATQQGSLISSGVSALQQFDSYFNASSGKKGEEKNASDKNEEKGQNAEGNKGKNPDLIDDGDNDKKKPNAASEEEIKKEYAKIGAQQSEKMEEAIEEAAYKAGIKSNISVDSNGQYVQITMNGAMLFESGKYAHKADSEPVLNKLSAILETYSSNLIMVEGHTDNVPIRSSKIESNDVLSMYRALDIADYIRSRTAIDPSHIVSSGRGEYDPVESNDTAEGRSMNRRVVIKIYNSQNSQAVQNDNSSNSN